MVSISPLRLFPSIARVSRLLLVALACSAAAWAQDSGALLDILVRKGILTNQEAEDVRADLIRDSNTVPAHAMANGKSTDRLSVGMRAQIQYAHLNTDIRGAALQPASVDHSLLRRMYLTLKANVGGNWGATITYDFASAGYDDAYFDWRPTPDLTFNFGLRKVNVAYEERASSGNIKALERSGVTRYFVESNNGRRLGAASYRIGAFLDGKKAISPSTDFVYSAAITNPERNETFNLAAAAGDSTNNTPALWGNVGLTGRFAENAGTWIAGVGAAHLGDQGGLGTVNLGRGFDLTLYSVYTDITHGRWGFMGEYLRADVDRGAGANRDATPHGFFLQPSFLVTESLEAVAVYQSLETDGRGVTLSDVVRSAASAPTMNRFTGWYLGGNWYLRGNDLKFQLGLLHGKTRDTVAGAPAEAKTTGVRSQMQVQF